MFGRRRPPADLVRQLAPDDRVVAWATTADGATVLASQIGLWWPDGDGNRLIGWERIDKATWTEAGLTVVEAEVVDGVLLVDRPAATVQIAEPGDLPHVVRRRVEASVARSELQPVPGGLARFVARRVPGLNGLTWWARLEPGTRDSAEVRQAVADLIEQLSVPAG